MTDEEMAIAAASAITAAVAQAWFGAFFPRPVPEGTTPDYPLREFEERVDVVLRLFGKLIPACREQIQAARR